MSLSVEKSSPDTIPFAQFEWMLALRYLRSRRRESLISVIAGFSFLGITLGVATMIVVLSVMNGFREELRSKFLGINGHILVYLAHANMPEVNAVSARIRGIEGVKSVFPAVEGVVLASTPHDSSGASLRGMEPSDVAELKAVVDYLRFGSLAEFGTEKGILIGSGLARKLGAYEGARISLLTPHGAATPFGVAPRVVSYKVLGVFELGMPEYDASLVLMPYEDARSFLGTKKGDFFLEVTVDDADAVTRYRNRIREAIGSDFILFDWRERNRSLFAALEMERNVMFLILMQIIFVAVLNIVSSLVILVKDKEPEIGLLRAMGATRGAVMRVFFIAGSSIGILGTGIGLCTGLLVCSNMDIVQKIVSTLTGTKQGMKIDHHFLSHLPVDVDMAETAGVVILALCFSLLGTSYPAWRASRLDPMESLRYE